MGEQRRQVRQVYVIVTAAVEGATIFS